jgi:hypothetical protein
VEFKAVERKLGDVEMAFMGGIEGSAQDTDPKSAQGERRRGRNFRVA